VTSVPSATRPVETARQPLPVLSLAVADTVTIPETVAPFAGAVIDTVGAVLSIVTLTVALVVSCLPRPAPAQTTYETRCSPSCCSTRWSRVLL